MTQSITCAAIHIGGKIESVWNPHKSNFREIGISMKDDMMIFLLNKNSIVLSIQMLSLSAGLITSQCFQLIQKNQMKYQSNQLTFKDSLELA